MPKPSQFVVITAGDSAYFLAILNLIGSIQHHAPAVDAVIVYDLGLRGWHKSILSSINRVEVRPVEHFVPHWRQCWSWKPWAWSAVDAEVVLYVDAGTEVLRDLREVQEAIARDGYFAVSQNQVGGNHFLQDIVPDDYFGRFHLPSSFKSAEVMGAGVIGFKKPSVFAAKVINPTLEAVKQGYNLGWSRAELGRNRGMHYLPDPPVRNCQYFRHDQTLMNIALYKAFPHPIIHPLEKYATIEPPTSNSLQLIWHHRRQSRLPWASAVQFRWHGWLLKPWISALRLWRAVKGIATQKDVP